MAGPDLRPTDDNPRPPEQATVWLDAVRLAPEGAKPEFTTRQPIEFGVTTSRSGNIFGWREPLDFRFAFARTEDEGERPCCSTCG